MGEIEAEERKGEVESKRKRRGFTSRKVILLGRVTIDHQKNGRRRVAEVNSKLSEGKML